MSGTGQADSAETKPGSIAVCRQTEVELYTLNYNGQEQQVIPARATYADGALCLVLWDAEGDEAKMHKITVNLPGSNAMPNEFGLAYVDTNNHAYIRDFVEDNSLAEYVAGGDRVSGFCTYPLYKFDLEKFAPLETLVAMG